MAAGGADPGKGVVMLSPVAKVNRTIVRIAVIWIVCVVGFVAILLPTLVHVGGLLLRILEKAAA